MVDASDIPVITAPPLLPCACSALRRGGRALSRIYDAELAGFGLRVTQYAVLAALARSGPISVSTLADELVMDRSTLSRNLLPLERAGWVAIETGTDRRTRCANLTDAGARRLAEARPAWRAAQEKIAHGFGQERLSALLAEVGAIVQVAQLAPGDGATVSD